MVSNLGKNAYFLRLHALFRLVVVVGVSECRFHVAPMIIEGFVWATSLLIGYSWKLVFTEAQNAVMDTDRWWVLGLPTTNADSASWPLRWFIQAFYRVVQNCEESFAFVRMRIGTPTSGRCFLVDIWCIQRGACYDLLWTSVRSENARTMELTKPSTDACDLASKVYTWHKVLKADCIHVRSACRAGKVFLPFSGVFGYSQVPWISAWWYRFTSATSFPRWIHRALWSIKIRKPPSGKSSERTVPFGERSHFE